MADFRISLPDAPDQIAQRELDWDRDSGTWSLSEREYGASRWSLNLKPTPYDLGQILVFFRMIEPVREEVLLHMTPGECVFAHIAQTSAGDVLANLCKECGEHWLVYRLDEGEWRKFGRTCSFAWHRGQLVTPADDPLLGDLLSGASN